MRKYIHDYYTDYSYNVQFCKYNTPADDTDSFLCYFWDVDINYDNITKRTYSSTREYFPVARMRLRHIPSVGMYLNFNSEIYTIKAVCIVGREDTSLGNSICYDIEVKKIEQGEEMI